MRGGSMRDYMGFLLGAAVSAACIVLLLPPPCPCTAAAGGGGGARPTFLQQLAFGNATQSDRGAKELDMGTAAVSPPEDDDLPRLLRSAATEDKTVIVTFTNEAWTAPGSLLDLFLESFRVGDKTEPLLKHLVIVAVDGKAFELCNRVHPLCYSLHGVAANFTVEQPYMSKDYLDMMWVRNKFQTRVLELGYSFVFTDVDIIWFRNALLRIPVGADIAIACDQFYGDDPYDVWKNANGGLLYAKPNARTIAFFKGWYEARKQHPGQHDQYVFDKVKHDLSRQHGAAVHFVDTAYFGGFCQAKKDFRHLCTFHGNCLKGLRTKLELLRKLLDEWKQFRITGHQQGEHNTTTAK